MADHRYQAHQTAVIDDGAEIGEGTRVWHFVHISSGARIGRGCVVGQGCFIDDVTVGDRVRIQNNVSIYRGVTIGDDVFLGPSCVFTNVATPRAEISRKHQFEPTVVERGATVGANATIVCGATIGAYAFIGAGAVVTGDVPAFALVLGVPGRMCGWMCRCGERLAVSADGRAQCGACSRRYRRNDDDKLTEEMPA